MGELGTLGDVIFTWARRMDRKMSEKFLIHALEFKLRPFKVYPYVCIGICDVLSPGVRYLENR